MLNNVYLGYVLSKEKQKQTNTQLVSKTSQKETEINRIVVVVMFQVHA